MVEELWNVTKQYFPKNLIGNSAATNHILLSVASTLNFLYTALPSYLILNLSQVPSKYSAHWNISPRFSFDKNSILADPTFDRYTTWMLPDLFSVSGPSTKLWKATMITHWSIQPRGLISNKCPAISLNKSIYILV